MFNRHIGIEIEVAEREEVSDNPNPSFWEKDYDGSVGIHPSLTEEDDEYYEDGGREFKFVKPLKGNDVVLAVDDLARYFAQKGDFCEVEEVDAGYHLHIDYSEKRAKGYEFAEVVNSLYDWMKNIVSHERHNNHYCRYFDTLKDAEDNRYSWVNITGLLENRRGTVEIRLHQSTKDADEILTWAEFFSELADCCDYMNLKPAKSKKDMVDIFNRMDISERTRERFAKALEKVS